MRYIVSGDLIIVRNCSELDWGLLFGLFNALLYAKCITVYLTSVMTFFEISSFVIF